jgi:hypothetical protein
MITMDVPDLAGLSPPEGSLSAACAETPDRRTNPKKAASEGNRLSILQADLAKYKRSRTLQPIKQRPARKDDDVGHDPEKAGQADNEAEKTKRREIVKITNLKAMR